MVLSLKYLARMAVLRLASDPRTRKKAKAVARAFAGEIQKLITIKVVPMRQAGRSAVRSNACRKIPIPLRQAGRSAARSNACREIPIPRDPAENLVGP